MPRYVLRYLPGRRFNHVVTDERSSYRRALCGIGPNPNHPSHDLWTADPEELKQRPVCHACCRVLDERQVPATVLGDSIEHLAAVALTQMAQEDGLV